MCVFLIYMLQECVAKEREDRNAKTTQEQDETPLFYSDIMPLLVSSFCLLLSIADNGSTVGQQYLLENIDE